MASNSSWKEESYKKLKSSGADLPSYYKQQLAGTYTPPAKYSTGSTGSGTYKMSADTYQRYETDYTNWKKTGQHSADYSVWSNQQDYDVWKNIRNGKYQAAQVGGDIYYLDKDSYKKYGRDYDVWAKTGSHSTDYGSWGNNDGATAFRYIRDDQNGYGGLNNLKASLDDELTQAVAKKFQSQWGDKYYYDVSNYDDIVAMNAGQMPTYLRKKYKTNDPVDQYLLEQGLPYSSLFNDMYSEAWQERNEKQVKKQKTLESAVKDISGYYDSMTGLKKAMVGGQSFEDALATGKYDALGDFYDASFGKVKDTDTEGEKYFKSKKTSLDPVYDKAYEAIMAGKAPDDEFYDQYKESTWKSFLKQKQKWNESSLQDVFDYQAHQQAGTFLSENVDPSKMRPASKKEMQDAGYTIRSGYTMLSPEVYTSKDGSKSIVLNPFREDGTIIHKAELDKIAARRLGEAKLFQNGKGKDDDSVFIAEFDTKKEAREFAKRLSDAATEYYGTDQDDFEQRLQAAMEQNQTHGVSEQIDLNNRPIISSDRMKAAKWDVEDGEYATVYSSGYSNKDGTETVLLTPITQDGERILTPKELQTYADKVLAGGEDTLGLVLGTFTGKDSVEQSNEFAEQLHQDQEKLYASQMAIQGYISQPDFMEVSENLNPATMPGTNAEKRDVQEILANYSNGAFQKILRGEEVGEFAASHVSAKDEQMLRSGEFDKYFSSRYMTEDEARTFQYIANKEGAAAAIKYIDDLLPELNARNTQSIADSAMRAVEELPALTWIAAGWAQYMKNPEGYIATINNAGAISGDEAMHATVADDPRFNFTRKYSLVDQILGERVNERFGGSKVANGAYTIATSMRDNLIRQATSMLFGGMFGKIGAEILSTGTVTGNVLGETLMEYMDHGVDVQKATGMAVLAAGAESLGEAVSMGKLMGFKETAAELTAELAKKGVEVTAGKLIWNWLGQTILTESGSEGITSAATMIAELLLMGDESDLVQTYNAAKEAGAAHPMWETVKHALGNIGSEAFAGGLTGMLLGGPGAVMNTRAIGQASGAQSNLFRSGLEAMELAGKEQIDFFTALDNKIELAVDENGTNIESSVRLQIQKDINDSTLLSEEQKNNLSTIFELVGAAPANTLDYDDREKLLDCVQTLHQSALDQNAKDAKAEQKQTKADQRLQKYFDAVTMYQLEAQQALQQGNLQKHAEAMNSLTNAVEQYKYALTEYDQQQNVDQAQQTADQEKANTKLDKQMQPVAEAAEKVKGWYQTLAAQTEVEIGQLEEQQKAQVLAEQETTQFLFDEMARLNAEYEQAQADGDINKVQDVTNELDNYRRMFGDDVIGAAIQYAIGGENGTENTGGPNAAGAGTGESGTAATELRNGEPGRNDVNQAQRVYGGVNSERETDNGPEGTSSPGESPAASWDKIDSGKLFADIANDFNKKHKLTGARALKASDFKPISQPVNEKSAKALHGAIQRNGGKPVHLYQTSSKNAPGGFVYNGEIYIRDTGTGLVAFEYGHELAHLNDLIQKTARGVFNRLGDEAKEAFANYCRIWKDNPNDKGNLVEFFCDIHGAYEYAIQNDNVNLYDQLGLTDEQAHAFFDAFSELDAQDSDFVIEGSEETVHEIATNGNPDYNYHSMGPLDLDALRYDPTLTDENKKLLDPVTYDDNGEVIPLSKRFNPEIKDPRFSSHNLQEPGANADTVNSDAVATAREAQDLYSSGTSVADYMARAVYDPDVARQLSGIENRNTPAPTGLTMDQRRQMYQWDRERLSKLKTEDRAKMIAQREKLLARESRAKSRENITRNATELREWLAAPNPKEGKYIPDFLRDSMMSALGGIDFGSAKREGGRFVRNWRKSMQDLANKITQYQLLNNLDEEDTRYNGVYLELPTGFARSFYDLAESIPENGTNYLQDMDADQLEQLDKSLAILKTSIANANKLHAAGRNQTVSEVSEATINDIGRKKAKRESGNKIIKFADEMVNMEMLDAGSYAKRLGKAGGAMIEGIRDGFINGTEKVHEAADFVDNMKDQEHISKNETYKWSHTPLTVTLESGETITMTEGQAMNLYALSNRPQALQHLLSGGVELGYNKATRNNQNRAYKLTYGDLDNVFNKLSDKQKRYVNRLQTYLSTTASQWGNEVSQKLYGIDMYGEPMYWPIRSAKSNLATQDPEKVRAMNAIMNSSFTKLTNKYASNPIMLDDATQVFTDHIAQMANYNGLAIPISDAMKWFNYQRRGEEGGVDYNATVKRAVVNAMGKAGTSYFINLIKDVNGLSEGGTGTGLPSAVVSNAKRAAVAAKLRVMIQQPTAIVRAMSMVNPKYFVGLSNAQLGKVIKEMHANAPIAWWKSQGNFDIGTGKSMRDILFGDGSAYERAMNATMAPAGLADDFGWAMIWNAVKREQQARNKGLSQEDLMKKVVQRFTSVINETQVIDTVVHRSQIMRSKDNLLKQATAFMSEPIKTFNMLHNAIYEAANGEPGAKGRLAKTTAAVIGSWALNAAVLALHDTLRDRDEDEEFWEHAKGEWLQEFMDNANPINSIPYIKDVAALLQGEDIDRMDMSSISDLATSLQRIYKAVTKGESAYTTYGLTRGLITSAGNLLGTPVSGLLNSAETIINGIKPGLLLRKKTKGWDRAEDLIAEGIDKKAARGLMKGYKSDNTATKVFSILTYDADKDGIPDFDEDEQTTIALALGLSYDPEKDGSLQDYAVKSAENYLKQKQKIMDDEDSTDEEYEKAAKAYDEYADIFDSYFQFLGL